MGNALYISENAEHIFLSEILRYFYIKDKLVHPPSIYLGNNVSKVTLENVVDAWALSSFQYVQLAIENVESSLKKCAKSLLRELILCCLPTTGPK